jgi:hypothetical protein
MNNSVTIGLIGAAVLALYNAKQIRQPAPVHYVDQLPLGYTAMTIPPWGIFIATQYQDNVALLQHELVHWEQYQRDGLLGFYGNYLTGYLVEGYDKMPYEIEARFIETPYCQLNYTQCVRNGTARTLYKPDFRQGFLSPSIVQHGIR